MKAPRLARGGKDQTLELTSSSTGVVTRENTGKLSDTILIRGLSGSQPSVFLVRPRESAQQALSVPGLLGDLVLQLGCRIRVTGVVSSGIAVPDIDEDVRDRFTRLDVDDTDVHEEEQSRLKFGQVASDGVTGSVIVRSCVRAEWGEMPKAIVREMASRHR